MVLLRVGFSGYCHWQVKTNSGVQPSIVHSFTTTQNIGSLLCSLHINIPDLCYPISNQIFTPLPPSPGIKWLREYILQLENAIKWFHFCLIHKMTGLFGMCLIPYVFKIKYPKRCCLWGPAWEQPFDFYGSLKDYPERKNNHDFFHATTFFSALRNNPFSSLYKSEEKYKIKIFPEQLRNQCFWRKLKTNIFQNIFQSPPPH